MIRTCHKDRYSPLQWQQGVMGQMCGVSISCIGGIGDMTHVLVNRESWARCSASVSSALPGFMCFCFCWRMSLLQVCCMCMCICVSYTDTSHVSYMLGVMYRRHDSCIGDMSFCWRVSLLQVCMCMCICVFVVIYRRHDSCVGDMCFCCCWALCVFVIFGVCGCCRYVCVCGARMYVFV